MINKILKSCLACGLGIMSLTACSVHISVNESEVDSGARYDTRFDDDGDEYLVKSSDQAVHVDVGGSGVYDYTYEVRWVPGYAWEDEAPDDYIDMDIAFLMLDSDGQVFSLESTCPSSTASAPEYTNNGIKTIASGVGTVRRDTDMACISLADVPAEVKLIYVFAYAHTTDEKPVNMHESMTQVDIDVLNQLGDNIFSVEGRYLDRGGHTDNAGDGVLLEWFYRPKTTDSSGAWMRGGALAYDDKVNVVTPSDSTFLANVKVQDWKTSVDQLC